MNECIVRGPDVIAIELLTSNLYKINFIKVHKANLADLVQSWRKEDPLEL